MKWIAFLVLLFSVGCSSSKLPEIHHTEFSQLPVWDNRYQTAEAVSYDSTEPEESLDGVQCPIPMKDRVPNYTGIQCVFSSTEMIGRWAECDKLMNPPITSRSNCKSYSGPNDLSQKLKQIGVRFEQSYQNREQSIALIKKAMAEGRGCLFGVPGHAMVLCHYDEENNVVRWVDNSDRSLKMQKSTVDWFKKRWDGWVCVVYAEEDLFPAKAHGGLANQIPVIDKNNPQQKYPKGYIPYPQK